MNLIKIKNPNNPLNKSVSIGNIFWIVLIIVLIIGNIFFISEYLNLKKDLQKEQSSVESQNLNIKILNFTQLFIEKVLKSDTEVDFETRLKLENSVRELDDSEILSKWQDFIDSQTEGEAQESVKNLLEILIGKIKTK